MKFSDDELLTLHFAARHCGVRGEREIVPQEKKRISARKEQRPSINYPPRTENLSKLAADYRPKGRPRFESEPVKISKFGVGSMGSDYGNFNFTKPIRSDFVDHQDKYRRAAIKIAISDSRKR